MRGFVLDTIRVRDEDLIVRILTKNEVLSLYRFYGTRHSYINVGYLIDFLVEETPKATINRLRNVVQLPFSFLLDIEKMVNFKIFIRLLNNHLRDISSVDSFYFNLLMEIVNNMQNRDSKRLLIESYTKLLEKEGRLHKEFECFLCERQIEKKVALVRAFLPSHEKCVYEKGFNIDKIQELFFNKKSLLFSDEEIQRLWKIMNLGF